MCTNYNAAYVVSNVDFQKHNQTEWPTNDKSTNMKKFTNNKCWRGCGEKEPSCTVGGNANCTATIENSCGDSLKIQEQNHHMTQQSHY